MRKQRGMALIELIIAIVVIGISVVTALSLLSSLAVNSAATLMRSQAASAATAYLENILAQPYLTIQSGTYNGINYTGLRDATGAVIVGLERYRVQIRTISVNIGTGANAALAMQVDVTITDPTGAPVLLTGYRTNYPTQVLY